jgi:hypothetical protein
MFQRMPGSASIRDLALVGKGVTASLLEEAGIRTLADVWGVDLDNVVPTLVQAAERLTMAGAHPDVQWSNILVRAFNRIILIHEAERIEADVPHEFMCSISHQYPQHPVRTPAGHLYDRVWIERWIRGTGTDPQTHGALSVQDLREATALLPLMQEYRVAYASGIIPTRTHAL